MSTPFLVKVLADEAGHAASLTEALRSELSARGASFALEIAPGPGASVVVGLWDPMGTPRWLAPLSVDGDAAQAAREVVAFLESWGFIPRAAAAGPAHA